MESSEFQQQLAEINQRTKTAMTGLIDMHCAAIAGLVSSGVSGPSAPVPDVNPASDPLYQLLKTTQDQMHVINAEATERLAESSRDIMDKLRVFVPGAASPALHQTSGD